MINGVWCGTGSVDTAGDATYRYERGMAREGAARQERRDAEEEGK